MSGFVPIAGLGGVLFWIFLSLQSIPLTLLDAAFQMKDRSFFLSLKISKQSITKAPFKTVPERRCSSFGKEGDSSISAPFLQFLTPF